MRGLPRHEDLLELEAYYSAVPVTGQFPPATSRICPLENTATGFSVVPSTASLWADCIVDVVREDRCEGSTSEQLEDIMSKHSALPIRLRILSVAHLVSIYREEALPQGCVLRHVGALVRPGIKLTPASHAARDKPDEADRHASCQQS